MMRRTNFGAVDQSEGEHHRRRAARRGGQPFAMASICTHLPSRSASAGLEIQLKETFRTVADQEPPVAVASRPKDPRRCW